SPTTGARSRGCRTRPGRSRERARLEVAPVGGDGARRSVAPRHDRGARSRGAARVGDRKSTRLNSSHVSISYAVFCLKKKKCIQNAFTTSDSKTNYKARIS